MFTNTKRDGPKTGKILGTDGVTTLAQGEGLSSIALIQHKVDTLSPAEELALATAMSTPGTRVLILIRIRGFGSQASTKNMPRARTRARSGWA